MSAFCYFNSLCGRTVGQIHGSLNLVGIWLVAAEKLVASALTLITAPFKS